APALSPLHSFPTRRSSDLFVPTDVRRWDEIDRLVTETVQQFGRLDVLVNNAGVLDGYATCLDTSLELFEQVMAINVRGVFFGCRSEEHTSELQSPYDLVCR